MDLGEIDRYLPQQAVCGSHEDWESHQHLKWAIRHEHIEVAKRLVHEGVPVNVNFRLSHSYQRVTPLHLAVYRGDLDLIKVLLDRGASVYAMDDFRETPLILSVRLRKYNLTDLLLTADIIDDLRYRIGKRINHLHIACLRNNIPAVKKLIALGEDVNKAVDKKYLYWAGYTPLHFAVESHGIEIVQLLLDNGADMMQKNANSLTPLHLAHEVRNETIIDILLSAQMFELGNPKDDLGLSHFHIACTRNNKEVVEFFLKQRVDVNEQVTDGWDKWSGYSPLKFAIYHECSDIVELLLLHGANLRAPFDFDDEYVELAYKVGNQKILDLVLTKNAMKNRKSPIREELSELQLACVKNDNDGLRKLFSETHINSDLNWPLWNKSTPLHFLVKSVPCEMTQILRESGGDMSMKDSREKSPLHIFFEYRFDGGKRFIPSDLFDFGKNPSDRSGLTHFHIACTTNQVAAVENFLKNGADVNGFIASDSVKWSGYTPLHFAVKYSQLGIVDLLLNHGAKISSGNGSGHTSFDMAILSLNESWHENDSEKFKIIQKMLLTEERSRDRFNKRGFSLLHIVCAISEEFDPVQLSNYVELLPGGIDHVINFPASKYHQCTPLQFASKNKNKNFAKWLIEKGANVHHKDCDGYSPFQYELDSTVCLGIIKSNPGIIRVAGNPFDYHGYSYFHQGCRLNDKQTMEFYVSLGVDINLRTKISRGTRYGGASPLHLVLSKNNKNLLHTVKFLLDYGADVMARDAYLNTPLQYMRNYFNRETAELLLDRGADVNAQNVFGATLLYKLCRGFEKSGRIKFLLENGADINIQADNGETPWTEVCQTLVVDADFCENVVLILLQHIKKLMVIGLHVSDKNREDYSKFFELNSTVIFREIAFGRKCLNEIEVMRMFRINQYTSMYDIIFKAPNEIAYLSQNALLRESITLGVLSKSFPIYSSLFFYLVSAPLLGFPPITAFPQAKVPVKTEGRQRF